MDSSKLYLCPMIRKDSFYPYEVEDTIEVKLDLGKYGTTVIPTKGGYKTKFFYNEYLEWLFYTGYIKEVKQ